MLSVIKFAGGLGNQMFQYAFYLAQKHKNPFNIYIWDIKDSQYCHNGFELPVIFKRICWFRKRINNFLRRRLPVFFSNIELINQIEPLRYYDSFEKKKNSLVTIYDGFWQSEKYFKGIEKTIRRTFEFDNRLLNDKTLLCYEEISECEAVSVHIRRGDYLIEDIRMTFDESYYQKSMEIIRAKVRNPHFYVFSDDKEYVKCLFASECCTIVDWNTGKDSWQDMFLMTKCRHNIIANSSFSWWGAWLNNYPQKVVIAPKVWFLKEYNLDIVPESWIRI